MSEETAMEPAEDLVEQPTFVKVAGPLVALGAAWAVRAAMEKAYTAATGSAPPRASDRSVPLRKVLLWAAATAAAVAVANVVVDRLTAPRPPA